MKKIYSELTTQYHQICLIEGGYTVDFENPEKNIYLQDDFYNIISDSFNWFESRVLNGQKIKGLDYCGVSELDIDNTKKFQKIIEAWYNLYKLGDNPIELIDYNNYGEEDVIRYFRFDKTKLLNELKEIIKFCNEAIELNVGIMVLGL